MSGAGAWRERVEDALWAELGLAMRRDRGQAGTLGPGAGPSGCEAVDAFEAIGLLDAGDAAAWRSRMLQHADPWQPSVDRVLLHQHLAALVGRARGEWPPGDATAELTVAVGLLRRIEALDDDDASWWRSLPHSGKGEEALAELPPCTLGRRRRSIPGPAERRRGLRVLAVDLFDDGICLHLQLARRGRDATGSLPPLRDERVPGAPLASRQMHVRLEDDLGTRYSVAGGGGGGGLGHVDGPFAREQLWIFRGGVGGGATRLLVCCGPETIAVPL